MSRSTFVIVSLYNDILNNNLQHSRTLRYSIKVSALAVLETTKVSSVFLSQCKGVNPNLIKFSNDL